MNETDYWRDRCAILAPTTHAEPPRWTTALPDEWEAERDRCRAMSRAARAHMGDLVDMFDTWATAWDRRHRAYVVITEARNRAAVSAVCDESDHETARQAFRAARTAEAERRAILTLAWSVVAGGGER